MKTGVLPVRTKQEIERLLRKNRVEDVPLIQEVEKHLRKRRGYVFRMPKPGSSVIVLLSGGLDSTTVCDILMRRYKLHVYPLYLRRGQIRMPIEEKSVDGFSSYFQETFPRLFHMPRKITVFIPPLEFRFDVSRRLRC
jgi:asparagine synthetase B (glutamine-hydrolysing)